MWSIASNDRRATLELDGMNATLSVMEKPSDGVWGKYMLEYQFIPFYNANKGFKQSAYHLGGYTVIGDLLQLGSMSDAVAVANTLLIVLVTRLNDFSEDTLGDLSSIE